jgi:hypothetical protein
MRNEKEPKMITIYQIQLTDEQIDIINANGHDAVPAQKAKLNVMFGAKNFNPADFQYYLPTMTVDTDNLEEAFELTNLWNDKSRINTLGPRKSSSSVGDIFRKGAQFYMVDSFGFTPLYFFNDEINEFA